MWESHALELGEVFGNLHVEGVVENETASQGSFGDKGQDLGGAGMDMRCVETAWFEPKGSKGNTETDKWRKVGTIGENYFTTETRSAWVSSRVEIELEVGGTVLDGFA